MVHTSQRMIFVADKVTLSAGESVLNWVSLVFFVTADEKLNFIIFASLGQAYNVYYETPLS